MSIIMLEHFLLHKILQKQDVLDRDVEEVDILVCCLSSP